MRLRVKPTTDATGWTIHDIDSDRWYMHRMPSEQYATFVREMLASQALLHAASIIETQFVASQDLIVT